MIILMKQRSDDDFHIDKVQLIQNKQLQPAQVFDFDADIIVSTCPSDSRDVLELALFCKVSFALYLPELHEIKTLLNQLKALKYRHMSKLLYVTPQYFQKDLTLLHALAEHFELVFEGDFQKIYHNLVFDVRERELEFFFEH
jgi:hypothetical protein